MSNSNYIKGRNKEYQCMKQLEKEGYYAFRMAGSHTPFDVIALLKQNELEYPIIRAIQCKAMKYISKREIKKLKNLILPNIVQKELWHFKPYQKKPFIIKI